MKKIQLQSHVGSDGVLHLNVPVGLTDTDLEVMLIVQPITTEVAIPKTTTWQPGFFTEVIGSWQGEPLVRPEQGDFETREELQ